MNTSGNSNQQTENVRRQGTPVLLLSSREAARALCICEKTLYNCTKSGGIPVARIGRAVRYNIEDLRESIKRRTEKFAENSSLC